MMSAIEVCVVAFCVAGIPGAGTSGVWLAVDAVRGAGTTGFAAGVVCAACTAAWVCLLVLRVVVFGKVRHARSLLLAPQLGDDYLKMTGGDAGTFTLEDGDDFAETAQQTSGEAPALRSPQPPRGPPTAPEEGGDAQVVIAGEDSDLFGGGGSTKKTKKTKKHRKTTKTSKPSPPAAAQTPPPDQ